MRAGSRVRWRVLQKALPIDLAQSTPDKLARHKHSNFIFLFPSDDRCMFYHCDYRTMRVASWDGVDEIEQPSHFQQKPMFRISFNGTVGHKIEYLPEGQKCISSDS
jgi:hypothetical protein